MGHGSDKQVYSNDDQGRVKQNCNFISPGAGYLCPYKLYSEIKSALFLLKSSSLFWGMIQTN